MPDRCKFCGAWLSAVDPGDDRDPREDKCETCAALWGEIARAAVQGFASNPGALTGEFVADRAHDCADAFLRRVHGVRRFPMATDLDTKALRALLDEATEPQRPGECLLDMMERRILAESRFAHSLREYAPALLTAADDEAGRLRAERAELLAVARTGWAVLAVEQHDVAERRSAARQAFFALFALSPELRKEVER